VDLANAASEESPDVSRNTKIQLGVCTLLVAVGVVSRLAASHWNLWYLASVAGPALFAGYYASSRWMALGVPVAILAISNLFLDPYSHPAIALVIYAALLLPVLLGGVLRRRMSALRLGACAAGSSLLFFAVSNFAHWCFYWDVHTTATLLKCYVDALPFYRYTFMGDLAWSSALFGGYYFATQFATQPAPAEVNSAA
jgi:hypothetical protein